MTEGSAGPVLAGDVPADLVAVAERHGQVVAAGDDAATLADFRPDRTGQLIESARLPDRLVSSRLLRLEAEPDGLVAAYIGYTADDGTFDPASADHRGVENPSGHGAQGQQARHNPGVTEFAGLAERGHLLTTDGGMRRSL